MAYPVKIVSTGIYIPERIVTNSELESSVTNYNPKLGGGSLDYWIRNHYGIEERRWSNVLPSDQAAKACQMAIDRSGLTVSDIDFLILNTAFGDTSQPTTATEVQKKIRMKPSSFAIEINSPCAGSVFGITTATHFLASGNYRNALVVGVDKMTGLVDMSDFKMAGLFGEGAGACVLSKSQDSGILATHLASSGELGNPQDYALRILGGKARYPTAKNKESEDLFYLQMRGGLVEDFVYQSFADSIEKLLSQSGISRKDIDHVVTHQAAESLIFNGLNRCGIDSDKATMTIREYGNTSAASMLITLDKLYNSQLEQHQLVLLLGMGGGLNWGGIIYQYTK
ncbi:MAG: 3-oxoacyl-[acyl-carrier-protein] synthase-3 [Bacteroidia bacterium]|jgi:3-oxoacyl-(acyl-carrier-protein) synthase III